jgi:hypothetical protein
VGDTFFWGKRNYHWRREMRSASNEQNWRKHCKSSSNFVWESSAYCQEHSRTSEHRQRNSQENLKMLTWGRCVQIGSKGAHRRTLTVREFLASKQITVLKHPPYSSDLTPNDLFLFPKIKELLKGGILMILMTSGVIRRQLWRPFHKTSSKIVLKGGLGAGINA